MLELPINAREYQDETSDDDELRTDYVDGNMLDVRLGARRDRARAAREDPLPADCAGLCGVCGKNLNDEPHTHEETHTDPRWAALEALRDQT